MEIFFEPYCMGPGEWQSSHARDEYESEYGAIGYRGSNRSGHKWYAHMPAAEIRRLVGPDIWAAYFKFTVIRNPFDKMVSAWYHFQKPKISLLQKIYHLLQEPSSLHFLKQGKLDIPLFRSWVRRGNKIQDRDKYFIDGAACVDFFVKYEALIEDMAKVCNILSIPWQPERLGSFKKGKRNTLLQWAEYYDEQTQDIVAQEYDWELKKFAYPLPLIGSSRDLL